MADKPPSRNHGAKLDTCVICSSSRRCGHTSRHRCKGMASQVCGPWAVCFQCSELVGQKLTVAGTQAISDQFTCPVCKAEVGPLSTLDAPEGLRQATVESAAQRAMRERNLLELRRILGIAPLGIIPSATLSQSGRSRDLQSDGVGARSASSLSAAPPTPGTQRARWAAVLSRRGIAADVGCGLVSSAEPAPVTKQGIAMGYAHASEAAAAPMAPVPAAARRQEPSAVACHDLDDATMSRCPDSLLQAFFNEHVKGDSESSSRADAKLQRQASDRVRDEVATIRKEEAVRRRSLSADAAERSRQQRDLEAARELEAERQRHKQEQDRLRLEAERQRQQEEVKRREWKEAKDREEKKLEDERRQLEEERQRLRDEQTQQQRREGERERDRLEECKERERIRLEVEHQQRETEIQRRVEEARLQIEVERRRRDEEQKRVEAERKRQREEQEEQMRLQKEADEQRRREEEEMRLQKERQEEKERKQAEHMRLQKERQEEKERMEAECLQQKEAELQKQIEAKNRKAEEDARLQMEAERRRRDEEHRCLQMEAERRRQKEEQTKEEEVRMQRDTEHRQQKEEQERLRVEADRRRRKEEVAKQQMEVERRRREQEQEQRRHLEQKCRRLEEEKMQLEARSQELVLEAEWQKLGGEKKRQPEEHDPRHGQKRQLDGQQQSFEIKRRQLEDEKLRVAEKRRALNRHVEEEQARVSEKRRLLDAEEQVIAEKRRRLDKEQSARKLSLANETPFVAPINREAVRPVHTPARASRTSTVTADDSGSKYPDHVVRAILTTHMKDSIDDLARGVPRARVTTQHHQAHGSSHNRVSQRSDAAAKPRPDDPKQSPTSKEAVLLARIQQRMRSATASQTSRPDGCAPPSSSNVHILSRDGGVVATAASGGKPSSALSGIASKACGNADTQLSQLYDQMRQTDKGAGQGSRKTVVKDKVDEQKQPDDLVARMRMLRQAYSLHSVPAP